jgi:hypothetical protein
MGENSGYPPLGPQEWRDKIGRKRGESKLLKTRRRIDLPIRGGSRSWKPKYSTYRLKFKKKEREEII